MVNEMRMGKNTSKGEQMVAFEFSTINYGKNLFAAVSGEGAETADRHKMDRLRQRCEVVYNWPQNGVTTRLPGVIRVRDVSGEGQWRFQDTSHSSKSGRGQMCDLHTKSSGFPVYHGESACNRTTITDENRNQPSVLRLVDSGEQINPRVASGMQRNGPTVKDLKEALRARSMSTAGNKTQLIERLASAVEVSDDEDEGDNFEGDESGEDVVYKITKVDGIRYVADQVQHRVFWDQGEPEFTWETGADSIIAAGWLLAPPLNTEESIQPELDANLERNVLQPTRKRRRKRRRK
jgi:hypothetical protein